MMMIMKMVIHNYENNDDNNDDTQGSSTVPYPRAITYIYSK